MMQKKSWVDRTQISLIEWRKFLGFLLWIHDKPIRRMCRGFRGKSSIGLI